MDSSISEAIDQAVAPRANDTPDVVPQKERAEAEHKSKPKIELDAERLRTSIARLTSNSIGELEGLASELQKLDDFVKYETDRVQRDIESLLSGIKIIVETISPWKRSTVAAPPLGPARAVLGGARSRDDIRRSPAGA